MNRLKTTHLNLAKKAPDLNSHHVQLLVSIRHRDEIAPALRGGCDILDLKDPLNGALGMVDAQTLRSISESLHAQPVAVPVSMALGELLEWQEDRSIPFIPAEITYLKMGLSHTAGQRNWHSHWLDVTKRIEEKNRTAFQWIAVAYADWKQAKAISPQKVLAAAIESQCAGLLIDTYSKQGQSLLDLLSLDELKALIEQAQSHNLKIALAGSINNENMVSLSEVSPDIIGIRGAACFKNQRTNGLQEQAVRKFRNQLDRQFAFTRSG
tara:strand:- start:34347 stop:35147 length:801 start_codon:yes stop_codon:yes gene_type:complete